MHFFLWFFHTFFDLLHILRIEGVENIDSEMPSALKLLFLLKLEKVNDITLELYSY